MQATLTALLAKATAELPTLRSRAEFETVKARYVGPQRRIHRVDPSRWAPCRRSRSQSIGKLINESKTTAAPRLSSTPPSRASPTPSSPPSSGLRSTPRCRPPTSAPAPIAPAHARCARRCAASCARSASPSPTALRLRPSTTAFDALNTPADHPARDEKDTFYFPRVRPFRQRHQKDARRKIPAPHAHLVGADSHHAQGRAAHPHRLARAGSTAATPPTPRTAPTSTSSSVSTSTKTSPSATSRRCSTTSSPRSSAGARRPASVRTTSATPSRASRSISLPTHLPKVKKDVDRNRRLRHGGSDGLRGRRLRP